MQMEPKIHKLEPLEERQYEFLTQVGTYKNVWYPKNGNDNNEDLTSNNDVSPPLNSWKQATQFQHPSQATWEQLMQSEESFARICTLCHELFVATASVTDADTLDWSTDFLTTILPFWESLRTDRANLALQFEQTTNNAPHKPILVESSKSANTNTTDAPTTGTSWMGWLQSLAGQGEENAAASTTTPTPAPLPPIQVTAHQDTEFAPNQYHYNKLIGRLYFHFPNESSSHDKGWLKQRATAMQSIVNQSPPNVLTDKIIRLLVKSYQDIGTMEASVQADKVYQQHPAHQLRLLWFVLMSYLKVTQTSPSSVDNTGDGAAGTSPNAVALATKRVFELLSEKSPNTNEFHSLVTIGFQCFANIPSNSLDNYYLRVHSLCLLKFGEPTWEALINEDTTSKTKEWKDDGPHSSLRPKDSKTLQLLIQIYGQDEAYLERAQRLLETMWRLYSVSDLQDSIERATFHSLLQMLNQRKQKRRNDTVHASSNEDFEFGLKLLDKMILAKAWWPNEETWIYLFRLADGGPQADEVWTKYELCRAITHDYSMTPLKATKFALKCWGHSADQGHPDAARRAWEIFRVLQVQSTPLLRTSKPEAVAHIYNVEYAPDGVVYTLVWKICARSHAWETGLKVYECAKAQGITFTGSMYCYVLRCARDCDDADRRLELAQEIYEMAVQHGKTTKPFLKHLRRVHPELYKTHLSENSRDGITDDDDEEDDEETK